MQNENKNTKFTYKYSIITTFSYVILITLHIRLCVLNSMCANLQKITLYNLQLFTNLLLKIFIHFMDLI